MKILMDSTIKFFGPYVLGILFIAFLTETNPFAIIRLLSQSELFLYVTWFVLAGFTMYVATKFFSKNEKEDE